MANIVKLCIDTVDYVPIYLNPTATIATVKTGFVCVYIILKNLNKY